MSDIVEEQYRRWNYPLAVDDMVEAISTGAYLEIGDPVNYWPLFWPARRGAGDPDILVAGCGTNQGAYYALRFPGSRVTAVDISETSLAHEEALKSRHGLDNLTLVNMSLLDIGDLGQQYDFITTTGVLHHLSDPVAGLSALRSVLRPNGVINVMVYGTSLRLGVYLMQDLFRTMGLRQTTEDVEIVRSVIASLPDRHVLRSYLQAAPDLDYDAGVVDTFLHVRDRSYYAGEVFDFAHEAGLEFLTWCDPVEYSLESHVPATHPAWSRLRELGERDASHACDLLTQSRGTHRFALAHPQYVAENRIPFDDDRFLDSAIVLHAQAARLDDAEQTSPDAVLYRRRGFTFAIDTGLHTLLDGMARGTVSLGTALDQLGLPDSARAELLASARTRFASLRSQGHVFVLLPE